MTLERFTLPDAEVQSAFLTGFPSIMSTGVATKEEFAAAKVAVAKAARDHALREVVKLLREKEHWSDWVEVEKAADYIDHLIWKAGQPTP